MFGTTVALAKRFLGKGGGYLGLETLIAAFYRSILQGTESPISPELISDTEKVADAVRGAVLRLGEQGRQQAASRDGDTVVVTGGTGFLGRRLVQELLERGHAVRVLSRGEPSPWARLPGVEYVTCDLGEGVPIEFLGGAGCVIHVAAATAGGFETHQRDSVDATRHVIEAAGQAGVPKVVYVSSLAVIDAKGRRQLDEQSPLLTGREAGPYAWGKATAEAEGARLARDRGVPLRVVRPGPIVDFERFDPPGRLGRWVGSWFVAVGPSRDRLYLVDVGFMARTLVWVAEHFQDAPPVLHGLSPTAPTRRELAALLRAANPGARVVWLPRFALVGLSGLATVLQKVLRPRRPALSLASAFASTRYETTLIESLESAISEESGRDVPKSEVVTAV
jgi:nucleoside-diphosphate-sugar epimerase